MQTIRSLIVDDEKFSRVSLKKLLKPYSQIEIVDEAADGVQAIEKIEARKPDLVFRSRKKVIFIHGCFWHQHGCQNSHMPKSNEGYWVPKMERNKQRDRKHLESLASKGEGRISAHDKQPPRLRQRGVDVVCNPVREIILLRLAT